MFGQFGSDIVVRYHQKEIAHEAETARLVHEAQLGTAPAHAGSVHMMDQLLHRFGTHLVRWGTRLQERCAEPQPCYPQ
jgi:hypothetical protein